MYAITANIQHELDFKRDARQKNWNVLPELEGSGLKVGDMVTFTNPYGVVFEGHKVLGFCEPFNDRRVFIDYDCYWFPCLVSSLKKVNQ